MSDKKYKIQHVLYISYDKYMLFNTNTPAYELSDDEIKTKFQITKTEDIPYISSDGIAYHIMQFNDTKDINNLTCIYLLHNTIPILVEDSKNLFYNGIFENSKYFMIIMDLNENYFENFNSYNQSISTIKETLEGYFRPYNELARKLLKQAIAESK